MRLTDVRVLDLTRLLPGPYATQLLADLGADVVKVEDTDTGDYARHMPPTVDGVGAVFDGVNRGKRSVALDLKSDAGREAFYALVEDADAVVESFRPGVVERLGVDSETLAEYNEDLVYVALTGYGQTGPLADRAGHDLNYVGRAGLLDMTRESEAEAPRVPGYQIGDLSGGLFTAFAVVSGLLSRSFGNGGSYVDVAMADVALTFGQAHAAEAFGAGRSEGENGPRPGETPLTGAYPWYDVYEASDGYVTLAALEPQFWAAFCEAVDREDLRSYHMTDDDAERAALREELADLFAERTREEWAELGPQTTVEPVLTPAEAVDDESVRERVVVDANGDRPRLGFPAVTDRPDPEESVPGHGEHTDTILHEAGYDDATIADLRDSGAIR
ncbi:CaiB/BaiF CoA transferase family protein [Halomarina oriensis]|uniref:CoA transferase n=1 Tax=Halomarina oriensis TaxID=671145 RepID=A0A6B0GFI5_9EURY|nr:CaiB/BaiF CoA-transferase family protein [Halomarina oriensis]MWG33582.1 CoA transferase [Halomarina oriensis]